MGRILILGLVFVALTGGCSKPDGTPVPPIVPSAKAPGHKSPAHSRDGGAPLPPKDPPNVILILIDTLRQDYLGFHGYRYETAPFLAALAKKSVVFNSAVSTSSWTAPAVASLFTSLYPPEHGVTLGFFAHKILTERGSGNWNTSLTLNRLPENRVTLPMRFKELGYRTFGIVSNINIGKEIGFERGFDRFEKKNDASAKSVYNRIEELKEEIVSRAPFFLYIHLNDPHHPYQAHKRHMRSKKSGKDIEAIRYRSEIGYVDTYLKKMVNLFDVDANTILMILSDHGEEFKDHGGIHHGRSLYQELNQILFMVYGAGRGIVPKRIEENVSLVDVFPTLMDLVGDAPLKHEEGVSLKPLIIEDKNKELLKKQLKERYLFAHRYSSVYELPIWAVIHKDLKLIDYFGQKKELFDTQKDPGEFKDLSKERKETVHRLDEMLKKFKNRMEKSQHNSKQVEVPLDNKLLKKLKSLGYVE